MKYILFVRAESAGQVIANSLDAVHTNRTAHQVRLARMVPDLDREFGETHAADEIRGCADAILAGYDDVPVRSMVQPIAFREARECLREDRCAAMTVG
jgi:hypothetical protein